MGRETDKQEWVAVCHKMKEGPYLALYSIDQLGLDMAKQYAQDFVSQFVPGHAEARLLLLTGHQTLRRIEK